MAVPIEIARRSQNPLVRDELLLRTHVDIQDEIVDWSGFRLLYLELSWIRRIHWVRMLGLSRNGFQSIPTEIGRYLKYVS